MKWWQILVSSILPTLRIAGLSFKNQDSNNTGRDDLIGVVLMFAADLLEWAVSGKDVPPPPVPDGLK